MDRSLNLCGEAVVRELRDEARRLDRSISWVAQKAVRLALAELRALPPRTEVES